MTVIVNAPGKVTSSPRALAGDISRWTSIRGAHAVFLTEVASAARGAVIGPACGRGWVVTRKQGAKTEIGLGECAILTNRNHYVKIHAEEWFKIWDGGGKGRLVHPIYAVAVVAETASGHIDVLTGLHTPAHVEGIWRRIPLPKRWKAKLLLRKSRGRVQTYLQVLHSWREQTMHLAAHYRADDVIAAPDGNLDAHQKWVRELLHRAWAGMHLAVSKQPDLGRRTVGWVLTTMDPKKSHVEPAKASDHDAGVYTLQRINATPGRKPDPAKVPPAPSTRCTYNGAGMDVFTRTGLQTLEKSPLGDLAPLTVLQGCWNQGGVAASAGTHDRSGVLDLSPFDYGRKVKAWRDALGPAWHRTAVLGLWGEHIHCVITSCTQLAPGAAQQIPEYFAGQDGLADHARDPNQHHPRVKFDYPSAWHAING